MAFNLLRNSRVFFTTHLDTSGNVNISGLTNANTFEIQVLDGFSFSQNTTAETVTLNEAGATPSRGQRSFNTSLEPVDFTFSTYIRPYDTGTAIYAEEAVLWNALLGSAAIDAAVSDGKGPAWSVTGGTATIAPTYSNKHQLQAFGLIVVMDNTTFVINNCVLDQASIDFGLDAIAMVAWTGKGATLEQHGAAGCTLTYPGDVPTFTGTAVAGTAKAKNVDALYIANKLSTMTVTKGIGGSGTAYTIPLTGGNLTIANNITYLTPANLGTVNKPITYFTGTRAISGSVTAYLRTGTAGDTGSLLTALLAPGSSGIDDTDPEFKALIIMGGSGSTSPRVELDMSAAMLSIPAVNVEQVVSTTINFTAQGYNGTAFDIGAVNELVVRYVMTV